MGSAAAVAEARRLTLQMCNAPLGEYECVFTAGATGTFEPLVCLLIHLPAQPTQKQTTRTDVAAGCRDGSLCSQEQPLVAALKTATSPSYHSPIVSFTGLLCSQAGIKFHSGLMLTMQVNRNLHAGAVTSPTCRRCLRMGSHKRWSL